MPPTYHSSNVQVLAGDHIEFKTRFFFMRGWVPGRVQYVSGHSLKREELERDGFAWVSIQHGKGSRISVLVLSETRQLSPLVRFVKRADDRAVANRPDHSLGD